jgi:hypothetical protein
MKAVQAASCTNADLQTPVPGQRWMLRSVQMVTQTSTGHVFVDEDHLTHLIAVTDQLRNITVADL